MPNGNFKSRRENERIACDQVAPQTRKEMARTGR